MTRNAAPKIALATSGTEDRHVAGRPAPPAYSTLPQRLTFTVPGEAVPQGNLKSYVPKGWTRAILTSDNPRTKPWRAQVACAAIEAQFTHGGWPRISEHAIRLDIDCYFIRPVSVPERKRPFMVVRPDASKLVRAIEDALTKILWRDDSQVVDLRISKHYAPAGEPAHTVIRVQELLLFPI